MNFQMEVPVGATAGATGTWTCNLTAMPDPVAFGCFSRSDSTGTTTGMHLNTQLTGTDYDAGRLALTQLAERWRLAYYGVTVYYDGPALADQGTVVAASVPIEHSVYPFVGVTATASEKTALNAIVFQTSDVPVFTNLIRMPNAYTGQAKHGVYFPMKLSSNHQKWQSTRTMLADGTGWTAYSDYCMTVPTVSTVPSGWPYYGDFSAYYATASAATVSHPRCAPCNENWGAMCFTNMSVDAKLTVVYRVGYEMQANPQSTLSAYLHLAPAYDRVAIDDYFAISRELKDAYPSDFNSLGKLWDVIKNAARAVLPVVRNLGPIGAGIGAIGDILMAPKSSPADSREPRDKPPAAAMERAQDLVAAAPYIPRVPAKPKAKKVKGVKMSR